MRRIISNMTWLRLFGAAFLITLLVLCVVLRGSGWKTKGMGVVIYDDGATNKTENVSMIQILADPEKYDGKRIRFVGYLVDEFECHAVFLSQESYVHLIMEQSIFLSHDFGKHRGLVHKRYCQVEGTYKAVPKGYMQANNGSLEDVSRVITWWN